MHCQETIKAPHDMRGVAAECPHCKADIEIPKLPIGPGIVIGGFLLKKKIGLGGMGDVYLAKQLSMSREAAVKVLHSSLSYNETMVSRFLKEARIMAKLEHPNIVEVYDAGEDEGRHYIGMERIDGMPLDDFLEQHGMVPEAEAVFAARGLADALRYSWEEKQILHRDIKPANIMVTREGEPKLLDLGLARSSSETARLTMVGEVLGTPNYMSPEQADGDMNLDFRADIYSMGGTLYTLLTNSVPFSDMDLDDLLIKQGKGLMRLEDPRKFAPNLSEACVKLIAAMMAVNVNDRYSSWPAVIDDIDRVLKGEAPKKFGAASVLQV